MNVVYFITSLRVGGAQKALLNLLEAGLHQQDDVRVVVLFQGGDVLDQAFRDLQIEVVNLGLNCPKNFLSGVLRFWRLCCRLQPALFHGWMHHGNVMASFASMITPGRSEVFWSIHHTPSYQSHGLHHRCLLKLGKYLSRSPKYIFFVSKRSLLRHQELGYYSKHAVVLPNGVPVKKQFDTQEHNNHSKYQQKIDESVGTLKAFLEIPEKHYIIGSLTRFVEEKDIPNLLKAASLLCQQRDDVHFVLAGEGMDEQNANLMQQISAQHLQKCVHLLGVQKDVTPLIAAMDIATLSSKREALPLFLAEAMMQGIPCVATDVGDVPVLLDGIGSVVTIEDPYALQHAWQVMLNLSPSARLSLVKNGQARISEHYSLQAVVKQYRTYLDTLSEKQPVELANKIN